MASHPQSAIAIRNRQMPINETHDPHLRSWVESANRPGTDFPIQNLPFGVFRRALTPEPPRVGIAIGDAILDLRQCHRAGLLDGDVALGEACADSSLNRLMALGQEAWSVLRRRVSELLREDRRRSFQKNVEPCLGTMAEAVLELPMAIGDYTDFYASIFHATNVGSMLRPDEPLLAELQVRAHRLSRPRLVGRASGTPVRRPTGQSKPESAAEPIVGPSRRLDYELEVGFSIGPGIALGTPIPIAEAEPHLFGVCLLNDWSARDIQAWEYQAARSVPREELRDVDPPVARDARRARAVSRAARSSGRRRSRSAAVSRHARRNASAARFDRPARGARSPAEQHACRRRSRRSSCRETACGICIGRPRSC